MSFRAVTWAFDRVRGLTATQKLVLLALAEFANDDDETWRSREAIAQRAECSVSSVNQTLGVLRDLGLVGVSGRYTWCDQDSGGCASRSAHKHRSGTVYKLFLDVEVAASKKRRPVDKSLGGSTLANSASVEEVASSCGKVHTYKSCKCGPTLAGGSIPHLQPGASVLSINPQLNPQPTDRDLDVLASAPVEVGSVEDSTGGGVAVPGGDGTRQEGLDLVARCLPEHLRVLDAEGLVLVSGLLAERLDAGWSESQILRVMDQPLPSRVDRLASLVAYRLRRNVVPSLAPRRTARARPSPAAVAVGPVVRPSDVAWDRWVWDPVFSGVVSDVDVASPAQIIAATREASRVLADRGLSPGLWRGFWAEAVAGRPELDPEDFDDQKVLADLACRVAERMSHASGS